MAGGQAFSQRVEHTDSGIEDHQVDDDRHDGTQCRVNAIDEGKHRDIGPLSLVRVHQQGETCKAHHDGVNYSAYDAAPTSLAWADIVTTDN